jgi:hypothetical protein
MKYLYMVFFDEKKLEALSASELQALDDESLADHYCPALRTPSLPLRNDSSKS